MMRIRNGGKGSRFAAMVVGLLVSCETECAGKEAVQSVLHPASGEAAAIAHVWWLLFWVLTLVFVLVMILTVWAILKRGREDTGRKARFGGGAAVFLAGGIFPAITLAGLFLFVSLEPGAELRVPDDELVIEVTGRRWWWEVRYPASGVVTANELVIPAGRPTVIHLKSTDVIHSFWVPSLHGKMDAIPGVVNRFWLQPEEPGKWRGQCAEFCGRQHALMAFWVVALPPGEFAIWTARRQVAPRDPEKPRLVRGKEAFFRAACNECHTIRGTEAGGLAGPDLTDIGARLTLGAGTIPNNRGNLMGWIADPQALKPGNLMPRSYLKADELEAIADYLESLD